MTTTDDRDRLDQMQTRMLIELEPVVAQNLERHIGIAKDWMPHDYIPWSEGKDYAFLGGEDWQPGDSRLDPVAKTAMIVNLLTEDNLPSYHREIATRFGRDGAWGEWVGRWTAEEGRHGVALRDYLVVTRGVDPVKLENLRMIHMVAGYDSGEKSMLQTVAYVSFQELATRVSHRNTGKATGCPVAERLLQRIAVDENLHMVFYRNMMSAAFDLAPDDTMEAVLAEVVGFEMPGATMPDFNRNSLTIAMAGIYDQRLHFDDVIMPVLKFWKVFERTDFGPRGEKARQELSEYLDKLDQNAARFVTRREEAAARKAERQAAAGN